MQEISWLAEELLAFQKELCCIELYSLRMWPQGALT